MRKLNTKLSRNILRACRFNRHASNQPTDRFELYIAIMVTYLRLRSMYLKVSGRLYVVAGLPKGLPRGAPGRTAGHTDHRFDIRNRRRNSCEPRPYIPEPKQLFWGGPVALSHLLDELSLPVGQLFRVVRDHGQQILGFLAAAFGSLAGVLGKWVISHG